MKDGLFITHVFKHSWEVAKKSWQVLLAAYALIFFAGLVLPNFLEEGGPLMALLFFVIQLILGMGLSKVMILLSREEEVTFDSLKEVLPHFFKYLGGMVLKAIIVFLGFLLFILPGIIWAIKYSFVELLIVDKGLSPLDALKKSEEMTNGRKWDLVGAFAALGALAYVGIFGLFIGLAVTIPLAGLAFAGLYDYFLKKTK